MLAYSGRGLMAAADVDLSRFLAEHRPFLLNFASSQMEIETQFPDHLPTVHADIAQIRQVLVNLVTNAAEAVGHGTRPGRITLTAGVREFSREDIARVYLPLNETPGSYVFLGVTDNGPGISKETLEHLFDPFFSTKFVGRGLGLPVVFGIIRNHHGMIDIRTSEAGSTVTVFLPCAIPAAPGEATAPVIATAAPPLPPPLPTAPGDGHAAILVVDDEPAILNLVCKALTRAGYEAVTAEKGRHALDLVEAAPARFRLVILDLSMPGMNGEEVLAGIRLVAPHLPVILSSGYSEQDATALFNRNDLAAFLKKPYPIAVLLAKIRQILT